MKIRVTSCALLMLAGAAHAQTAWQAGVAKAVITPTESIWMAGYGDRNHPSEGVLRDRKRVV